MTREEQIEALEKIIKQHTHTYEDLDLNEHEYVNERELAQAILDSIELDEERLSIECAKVMVCTKGTPYSIEQINISLLVKAICQHKEVIKIKGE